ncbi:hypothetical protein HMPREF0322_04946 [Desulfitobacterium hafniense DP7]|uniref:Uncharacterized protein n=2 Tax=Desulfitobacterium hafniense TaxID=49338 RepID=A0A0W1JML3_DESHA|nr:hypothetical protein [Desulfitobacterium hafniense]EHL04436.1 hypothetical protein HMPREF0322_04946 [Desulfitobacterium hafniense DP7]KTE92408.1 hypothetical protein AT727_19680 [Desulfitobacterium hafniense]
MKKKKILIGGISLVLLFPFASVAIADEVTSAASQSTVQIVSRAAAQAQSPAEANDRITVGMAGMKGGSIDSNSTDIDLNETSHDMDMDKPDVQEGGQKAEEDGHGQSEKTQGKEHGEEEPAGVNWPVVWGFLGLNSLVIVSAGILKFMK